MKAKSIVLLRKKQRKDKAKEKEISFNHLIPSPIIISPCIKQIILNVALQTSVSLPFSLCSQTLGK